MIFSKRLIIAFYFIWVTIVSIIFDQYAYKIFEFNSSLRTFITLGKLHHRDFDENGLPVSYSPKIGEFRSPFYVVHYAIIYSNNLSEDYNKKNKKIWGVDTSIAFWNVPPNLATYKDNERKFKNSVDWIVNNISYSLNNHAHLIYDFDWTYIGYQNNKLQKGWWSGLTDAYAIIPLLRAYTIYGDQKYYLAAKDLYNSSLTSYLDGGSFTTLNGDPWIEEYVDPHVKTQHEFPYVFNGMVYATYGIDAFESLNTLDNRRISRKLFKSISNNIKLFNNNGWSHYDLYRQSNNIKYHLIHLALIEQMIENNEIDTNSSSVQKVYNDWRNTSRHSGFYYALYGNRGIGYYHLLLTYLTLVLLPIFLLGLKSKYKSRKQ